MAFDPEVATQAYLATLKGAARARSDAYFEGGYWLILWSFLVTVLSNGLLLKLGVARRLSEWTRRVSGRVWIRTFLFAAPWLLLVTVVELPYTLYTDFFREHQYGLSNQTMAAWAGEYAMEVGISTLIFGLIWIAIHAAIRRSPRNWWLIGSGITMVGLFIGVALAPVFIEPLFNKYTPLPESPVKQAVLSMARANQVPADNVYLVDASRQSKRISANVAGILGTTRVALNDNLMKQDADEIRAVMGHELGHYVLNHIWKMLLAFTLIFALTFLFVARTLEWAVARFGRPAGVNDLADPAILPFVIVLTSFVSMLLTPVNNTLIRTQEQEADQFGLNAARAPDGFARIAMKLSQYRKIEPGPWEEILFFDHPSGRTRVMTAMRWKAEHIGQPDVR